MARFKNHLLVVVGFALAGLIGAAFGTGTAQAVVSTLVTVVNTSANPAFTQHTAADNPATQAVSLLCQPLQQLSCSLTNGSLSNPPYVIPSGKRLVVESISGFLDVPTGQKLLVFYVLQDNVGQQYIFYPPLSFGEANVATDRYTWGLSVKLYAEQGTSIAGGANSAFTNGFFYAFGHLENIQ